MRTAQVATAVLAAILTFSGLHAAFGHRWYGWHHRYGHHYYGHCDDEGQHYRYGHDREDHFRDTTDRLP